MFSPPPFFAIRREPKKLWAPCGFCLSTPFPSYSKQFEESRPPQFLARPPQFLPVPGFGSPQTLSFTAMGKTSSRSDSKSNRKFEKKLEFYSKVKDAVTSLSAQKSIAKKKNKQQRRQRRQKKMKAYNLSSLLESLPELKAPQKPCREDNFKLNCKSRQKLVLMEGERLSAVLADPTFQADPIAAINEHLKNTQPVVEEQPKKKVNKNGFKKKKKKSKAETGLRSMDM